MKTIAAQIPEPVLKQAKALAVRENIPLDQVISLAITQGVGAWSQENDRATRTKDEGRNKFLNALTEALNAAPPMARELES